MTATKNDSSFFALEAQIEQQDKTDDEILNMSMSLLVTRVCAIALAVDDFRSRIGPGDMTGFKESFPKEFQQYIKILAAFTVQHDQSARELDRRFPVPG